MTYIPTDQQIDALAIEGLPYSLATQPEKRRHIREILALPAFRDVIRAAQAAAWQDGYSRTQDDDNPYEAGA